jgi:hypothetical protein
MQKEPGTEQRETASRLLAQRPWLLFQGNKKPETVRLLYDTRSDSRTVATSRSWRGWQVCAA